MYAIAALTALIAGVSAAPSTLLSRASYVSYNGDGSTGQGWPDASKWTDFETMWKANQQIISGGCSWMAIPNNTPQETSDLHDAIVKVAGETKVDSRVVLAIVLQESQGCVRVWGTNNGVFNPGLMQDHAGTHWCNDGVGKIGNLKQPCPQDQIEGMIEDGTKGTAAGDGLVGLLGGKSDSQDVYVMARKYNSGSVAAGGDLSNANGATASYVSDVANRLMGVTFASTGFVAGAPGSGPASAPASSGPANTSGQTSTSSSSGSYTVKSGDSCWAIANAHGLTVAALEAKNPSLGSACVLQPGQTLSL